MEHGRDNGSGAGWERLAAVQGRPVTRPGRVPASFSARLADEADQDEQFWRDRLNRSHLLLAERDGRPQGIASLGPYAAEPSAGEIFGLYVVPEARGTGVSWRLVEAAAALASREGHRQLYYWVGVDNGRAVGFAKTSGSALQAPAAHPGSLTSRWAIVRQPLSCRSCPTTHRCPTRPATSWHPGRARSAESTAADLGEAWLSKIRRPLRSKISQTTRRLRQAIQDRLRRRVVVTTCR